MKMRAWIPTLLFSLLAAGAIAGLVLTRPAHQPKAPASTVRREHLVDESPLLTARALVVLAVTPEEKILARQAERLANHEVDLAFTDQLRAATENPPAPTPQSAGLLAQRAAQEAAVEAGRLQVTQLEKRAKAAPERERDALEDQLEVARAQLELDQDELEQVGEALERLGADPQGRIRRLKAAHAAADQIVVGPIATGSSFFQPESLLARVKVWTGARAKLARILQAQADSRSKSARLEERRVKFAQRAQDEKQGRDQAKQQAAGFAQGTAAKADSRQEAKANLAALKRYMSGQRRLGDMGKRLQDQHDLAETYGQWSLLVQVQRQAALHAVLRDLLLVLLILFAVNLADRAFEWLFARQVKEEKRVGRMLKVVKFATLAVGILIILFVLFGLPGQLTTLFGLAGAGLTVALKDFIMAFFGWFILVGRNGIHVGDWVEIKGVAGEVVEIGLLRTLLMETGNWNDASHPTGRIVSFVNSFAMEGHFFNFSTSGQWMWDELTVLAPAGQDPYPLVEAIRARVTAETAAGARIAEEEWKKANRSSRVPVFTAQPELNVVPTGSGVEIRVRYLTRAFERAQTRTSLNQAVLEILRGQVVTAGD
jgi:small-conductance mechanosensitive channel